jgi:hypothetical protein
MSRLYYILDTRSYVGNCGLWWGPKSSGYVCDIDDAGQYEEDEAFRIQRGRGTDVAIPCDEVEKYVVRHVRVDTSKFHELRMRCRDRDGKRGEP